MLFLLKKMHHCLLEKKIYVQGSILAPIKVQSRVKQIRKKEKRNLRFKNRFYL
jgi:hypothetical protein